MATSTSQADQGDQQGYGVANISEESLPRSQEQSDIQIIEQIITDYFDGLYEADIDKLDRIFHDDAVLKAPGLRRSKNDWLQAVASRPVPKTEGESYRFNLIAIDVIGDQAMVKLECPLFEKFYIDFIGLLKEQGRWLIVNKMYCDMAR